MLIQTVDYRDPHSSALRHRQRRHRLFLKLIAGLHRPVRLLDVGGTADYWRTMGIPHGVEITALNLEGGHNNTPNVTVLHGDACDLSRYKDREFDVVFSNSTLEHVGLGEKLRKAASEMLRVGRAYFIQTPNRWFPIEPHFLLPCFQFLPLRIQVLALTHIPTPWSYGLPDEHEARLRAESVHLLCRKQVRELFPDATIWHERVLGLTKSFVAYGGFEGSTKCGG